MGHFLNLPLEVREQIYAHLLLFTCPDTSFPPPSADISPSLHPAILSVCHQTHAEALPFLYAQNTFACHQTLLTSFPRLYSLPSAASGSVSSFRTIGAAQLSRPDGGRYPQLTETRCPGVALIRRWYLWARLDCGPFWDGETVRAAFSGAEELILEVWQSTFGACGNEVLRVFEGVRGVRRVRISGSTTGMEEYVRWLEDMMRSPVGSEVVPYLRSDDEAKSGGRCRIENLDCSEPFMNDEETSKLV